MTHYFKKKIGLLFLLLIFFSYPLATFSAELTSNTEVQTLRHLGVNYANFVNSGTDGLTGLDVELIRRFAGYLGIQYEWVQTSWSTVLSDLPQKGDLIANGLTILPSREELVAFSTPTFPTGVWLIAKADSAIQPVSPSGDIRKDIEEVKRKMKDHSVLSMKNTCLDSTLYGLDQYGANISIFTASENLHDMAPALLEGQAETTLLDIPDALIALQKWPGDIKIIGPVSEYQEMGVAFPKGHQKMLNKFNLFFEELKKSGEYRKMVEKYYPTVFLYYDDFFISN